MNNGRPENTGGGYHSYRGRFPRSSDRSYYRPVPAGGDGPFVAGSSSTNSGVFQDRSSHQMSSRNPPKYKLKQTSSSERLQWRPLNGGKGASLNDGNLQQKLNSADCICNASEQLLESIASNSVSDKELSSSCDRYVSEDLLSDVARVQIGEPTAEGASDSNPLPNDHCKRFDATKQLLKIELPLEPCAKDENSSIKLMENNVSDSKESEDPKPSVNLDRFDICPPKSGAVVLKPSFLVKNREKRNDMKRAKEGNNEIVLRPGMILLKSGISLKDQVKVVNKCRDVGLGSGGFYQPGYRDGGKLHLKMMCLGKNWDPETSTYGEIRPIDDAKPPRIPDEFYKLVEMAMEDSHTLIAKDSTTKDPENILPWMKPNICLVNFYSQNGRLGLHQDRDESRESLEKGLPVVSFSIGDSAEFLFGDKSDPSQAEKVTLESGDILIFGGKSRHVFHGVTTIHPNTAPKSLLEETDLRSGRLNLTFRQS